MAKLPAAAAKAAEPAQPFVNFLDLALYTAGGQTVPEGNYALSFEVKMHQSTDKATGQPKPNQKPRLVTMVTFWPINEKGQLTGESIEKPYGLGSNADKCFVPDETGKKLLPIPNAPYQTFMMSTNWGLFLKSLHDCGLGEAIRAGQLEPNSFEGVDGIWVHIQNVPEPEERKGYTKKSDTSEAAILAAATGQAQPQEDRKPGLVPVATAILAKPWEGEGGLPTEEAPHEDKPAAAPAKPKVKAPVKPAVAPAAPATPPPAAASEGDEDVMVLAVSALGSVLEANLDEAGNPKALKRLKLRTEVFKAAGENANAVTSLAFKDDATLNGLLNQLGYKVNGADIVPA